MSDHINDCCEYNVACDVSNCAYNADGKRCHADHIQVKNTQGTCTCKDETFCSTFTRFCSVPDILFISRQFIH